MGEQFKGATGGKYIYMDTDVINFNDLSEMYNNEVNNSSYFCGPLDFANMNLELLQLQISSEKYMNSCIVLMNLKAMRNNGIENQIRNFVSSHFLNHHEQTAINAYVIIIFKYYLTNMLSLHYLIQQVY